MKAHTETELELETHDGFSLVVSVNQEGVVWEWWTPAGKTELASWIVTHEEMRSTASSSLPNNVHPARSRLDTVQKGTTDESNRKL